VAKLSSRVPAYKLAALEIRDYIGRHGLKGGEALPPEAALAQQIGISRPSLREGMKALESVGVLQARHGEGVFVSGFSFDAIVENLPYSMLADDLQLLHLLEVRTALEVGMVPRIVGLIPSEDVGRLRQLAQRMLQRAQAGESFAEEDRAFHATLFACLGNPFLDRLVDLFWQVFHRMADTLPQIGPSSRLQTAREHLAIVDNLASGDARALQQAHERHFDEIRKRVTSLRSPAGVPKAANAVAPAATESPSNPQPEVRVAEAATVSSPGHQETASS
jgi:DNA-binding FadR family transcriptional regulator